MMNSLRPARRFFQSPLFVIIFVAVASLLVNLYVLNESFDWGHWLYLGGVLLFCCSYLAVSYFFYRVDRGVLVGRLGLLFEPSRCVVSLYWFFSILSLLLSLYKMYTVGWLGDKGAFFLNLRYAVSFEGVSSYGAQHFALFAIALSLYYSQKGMLFKTACAGGVYLISALSLAERTSILFLFVSVFYSLLFVGRLRFKGVFLAGCFLIFLFVVIAVGAGKTGSGGYFGFIFDYFGYGLTSLSDWLKGREFDGCGVLVFGTLYKYLTLGAASCDQVDDLFNITDRFNVYTYVASPYLYGGSLGVVVFMLALGGWYSFLWNIALRRRGYFLAILSIYMYAVVMVFYAWQFSLTTYLYMFFVLIPLFVKIKVTGREGLGV